jgi:predicted small metal-binding protein
MKSMTCSQLGGACELELFGETFSEIAQQSQSHGKEMFAQNDQAHIEAMNKMMEIMNSGQMNAWMKEKENLFNSL